MDELLSLEDTEHTVNFKSGSKDIVMIQKSAKRADKIFTVHVINSSDPLLITWTPYEKFQIAVDKLMSRLGK